MNRPIIGGPVPAFVGPTVGQARFAFSSVGGRYALLGFLPEDPSRREAVLKAIGRHRALLDDDNAAAFVVLRDEATIQRARDQRGLRWYVDRDGAISRLYGALSEDGQEHPFWVLLDPMMRVLHLAGPEQTDWIMQRLAALPPPDRHAGVPMHAPVLIVPRVLDPDFCRQLIDYYEADGGSPSGVMREIGGRTVGVLDDFKKRRDTLIVDEQIQARLRDCIAHRLTHEIRKVFQFKATRIERYIVAAYDAEEGGYFRAHRDDTTSGTAHRKFAVTINLNADEYEGGDLRFPEFGPATYRAPTGGAVVFSCSLLHEATPVTKGRRYATLPFLYDDEGAAIRARNLSLLDPPPTEDQVESQGQTPAEAQPAAAG